MNTSLLNDTQDYSQDEEEEDLLLPRMGNRIERKRKGLFSMNKSVYALTFLSAVGGFLFGYDTGVVSGAMLLIEKDDRIKPDTLWKELIVASTVGAAGIFALVGGFLNEYFGRKPTILSASVIFAIGSVIMGISVTKEILLIGRVVVGAGIGLASMSVPMYISEASPPEFRGVLVTCNNLIITFGQFVAACVCGAFSKIEPDGWKWMLGLAGIPAVIQFIGFIFMPESPRWLVSHGKFDEAKKVLFKIRAPDENPEQEFREIQRAVEEEKAAIQNVSVIRKALTTPSTRRALILGCLLQAFQQLAGINTVMYYSAKIISLAGITDDSQAIWMSAGVASVNFLCTFIGIFLVERIGRRKLLLGCMIGVCVSLAILAIGFQLADTNTPLVTVIEDEDDACHSYKNCGDCTFNIECGYCFVDPTTSNEENTLAQNGSCVEIDSDHAHFAQYGRCSAENSTSDITFASDYCPSNYAWLIMVGLVLYLFFFAPGMGPMPWTLNSEIYPLWARSFGVSVATSVNWAFNLLISMTFLTLLEAITKQGAFYLYTGITVIGFFIFAWILPETKGKSLEEVEQLFNEPNVCCGNSRR